MFFRKAAFLVLFFVATTGNADEPTLNRFLSGEWQARRIILNEMIIKRRQPFTDREQLLLARKAQQSTEQEELRKSALEAIHVSARAPVYGAPLDRLPDGITDVLFEIIKDEKNSEDILEYAAGCLMLSMDNSEQGVANEKRMISFLDSQFSGKVSEVYHTSYRHFPLQRDGVGWKSIVATLKSGQVKEKWRFQLYDSLEVMEAVKLLKSTDFDHLLQIAYNNPSCNVQCRTRILAKEGLMRFRNGPSLSPPDWVKDTVEEHYLNEKKAGSELDYFVSKVARRPTDNKIIVEKAMERVIKKETPTGICIDSMKIILNFQGDRKIVLQLIDNYGLEFLLKDSDE